MKVILIEDQSLLSSALISALEQDETIELSGRSDKASDAIELCEKHKPDVVIMDVYTQDGNGIETTTRLKQLFPMIKVIVMSGVADERLVQEAEQAGADIFTWKNITLHEFLEFIHYTKKPFRVFPVVKRDPAGKAKLSDIDMQIIRLLARGKNSREIAEELFLGYGTVRLYISRMYAATGLSSRAQLVAYALSSGLIDPI